MMKGAMILTARLAALLLVVAAAAAAGRPAAGSEIVEVTSPGGVTAWLKQEEAIPMIAVSAIWRDGGAVSDPEGKAGRANLVSALLDEGAGEMDSQTFQTRLEEHGVRLSFEAGRDTFGMSLQSLTQNAGEAFRLAGLALTSPRFDADAIERMRQQILIGIARDLQNPNAIAGRVFSETAFGDDPYGRSTDGTQDSVSAIAQADLTGFVESRLAKDRLIVGVVGDISPEALKPLLDEAFGGLTETAAPAAGDGAELRQPGVRRVVTYDTPQTVFVFGAPGLARDDPDFEAARVMNHILGGGGFSSLLTEEIREKRGLTYGVYSYLRPMDRAALWLGGLSTSNDKAGEALDVLKETIRRFREEGPDDEQIEKAKANINGAFPLGLTSNRAIADLLVALQRYGLGKDYVERRPELINAVTREDIMRVAGELLNLDRLIVTAVGIPEGLAEKTSETQ